MKKTMTISKNILIWIGSLFLGLTLMGVLPAIIYITSPDYDDLMENECITTKIEKGYPEDFAKEYCLGDGKGCVEKKYSTDCNPELYCCFVTIEEDKKWNYLDYDENGNLIENNQQK